MQSYLQFNFQRSAHSVANKILYTNESSGRLYECVQVECSSDEEVSFSCGVKRCVSLAAAASTTSCLSVHQAAGEVVDERVEAAVGAC